LSVSRSVDTSRPAQVERKLRELCVEHAAQRAS
jgi:hypothetical protein